MFRTQSDIRNKLFPIIQKKLYFLISDKEPQTQQDVLCFNVDDQLYYQAFNEDFGPINLAYIYKFIKQLSQLLQNPDRQNIPIFFQTGIQKIYYTNAILMICAFQVIHLKKKPQQAYEQFGKYQITPFRDISEKKCLYACTILDCLKALDKAQKIDWFNMKTFDDIAFQSYAQKDRGNISQIIPNKVFVFKTPQTHSIDSYGNKQMVFKDYVEVCEELGISLIIDVSNKSTPNRNNQRILKQRGIRHMQIYLKEEKPSISIAQLFVKSIQVTQQNQKIAVNCSNGLGKSSTLIGCYLIKHYLLNARQCIAWIRLVRPGSLIGSQQFFLLQYQQHFQKGGQDSPVRLKLKKKITLQLQNEQSIQRNKSKNKSLREKRAKSAQKKQIQNPIKKFQLLMPPVKFRT